MRLTKITKEEKANLPNSLPMGELIFANDTEELFIGQGTGKALKKVNGADIKNLVSGKRDKNVLLSKGDYDLSKDSNKWDINDFNEETRKAILESNGIDINYVLGANSITSEHYTNGSINIEHTSFIENGYNLINPDTTTLAHYVNFYDGSLAYYEIGNPPESYSATDFIKVTPGQTYYLYDTPHQHFAFYDKNKKHVHRPFGDGDNRLPEPFVVPEGCEYARFTLWTRAINTTAMLSTLGNLEEGEFIPYGYHIKNFSNVLDSANIKEGAIKSKHIIDGAIKENHIEKISGNLIPHQSIKKEHLDIIDPQNLVDVEALTPNVMVLHSTGNLHENLGTYATDYMPVVEGKSYRHDGTAIQVMSERYCYYDKDFNPLTDVYHVEHGVQTANPFTVPKGKGVAYIRMTAVKGAEHLLYMVEGKTVPKPIPPFGAKLRKEYVPQITSDIIDSIDGKSVISKTITHEQVDFISSRNIFNPNTVVQGKYVFYSTGELYDNEIYTASDYMKVKPNTKYRMAHVWHNHFAFYDKDKNYIPNTDNNISDGHISPDNAYYLRVSIRNVEPSEVCIHEEDETGKYSYSAYHQSFDPKYLRKEGIQSEHIGSNAIQSGHIASHSISPRNLDFMEVTDNLFDKLTVTRNHYVNFNNGILYPHNNYSASDWILAEENTQYVCTQTRMVAFYNANKKWVGGFENTSSFTTVTGTRYIRITCGNSQSDLDSFQLKQGETLGSYIPHGYVISDKVLVKHLHPDAVKGLGEQISAKTDTATVLLPRHIPVLIGDTTTPEPYDLMFDNIILKNFESQYFKFGDNFNGKQYDNRFTVSPGTGDYPSTESTGFINAQVYSPRDLATPLVNKRIDFSFVPKKTNTKPIRLLAIGDSITRGGDYVKVIQSKLNNCKCVGTRQYSNENIGREGRGGWSLSSYFTNIVHTQWGDSPFLFPLEVEGAKYYGNTNNWKQTCYEDPRGYDWDGFQRIARDWTGTDYIFNENGYLKNPKVGDVMCDPTKSKPYQKWSGTQWEDMNPQPTGYEFNFSKYMEKNKIVFDTEGYPTHVSILLATNDFTTTSPTGNNIKTYLDRIKKVIESIHQYDPSIKIILCYDMRGGHQDNWSGSGNVWWLHDYHMKLHGKAMLEEFDTNEYLDQKVYVCNIGSGLVQENISDTVHPNYEGHTKMARNLAGVIQYTHN